MSRRIIFRLAVILLFIISLVSCNATLSSSTDLSESITDSEDSNDQFDNSVELSPGKSNEVMIATGIYNDKTITMEYYTITPYKIMHGALPGISNGYACVVISNGDNYGFAYVDAEGNILNNKFYDFAYSFDSDGRALVQLEDGSLRYINTSGEDIGPAEGPGASDTSMFYEENGKMGLLGEDGSRVTEPIFDGVSGFEKGYASVFSLKDGTMYVDRAGNLIRFPEPIRNSYIENGRIYCKFQSDSKCTVFDMTGKEILTKRYPALANCADKFYAVIEDSKLGLIDLSGNIIVPPTLECDYSEDMSFGYGEGYLTIIKDGNLAFVKITETELETE